MIMQNIFGCDGFFANAALGEGEVLGNSRVEVMGDHHHVEGFIERIYRVRSCRSRRSRDDVGFAAYFDDVWGVSAPSPFTVKSVNGSALERSDCILDETTFVERIGMDENLYIHVICN